jgi:hypothetical protein
MDYSTEPALKNLLQEWINDRQQALREQVLTVWRDGQERFIPDAALLQQILATAAPAPLQAAPPAGRNTDADLGRGLDLLQEAGTQGEVLKRLLESVLAFGERTALFVVKQGIASLYAQRGFESGSPKLGVPVVPPPELEQLLQGRTARIETAGPAYLALLGPLSAFEAGGVRILPVHLRRKIVALLLVDSGLAVPLEHPGHLRALTLGAESRLSFLAGSKEEERPVTTEALPSILTQRIPEPIAESSAPALEPSIRTNAERSARVLVGDIELYFPAKVAQGQQLGNLYAVMRDELDRSRASFVERYGNDLETQHQIFYKTVVQQLCAGDPSRLGPAPWVAR